MEIWSFKCKWCPNGSLNKHQDYWDTYAPVVTWAGVRMLLIVSKIHKLESKSIDFVLAFPQADLDVPVYIELPAGVTPLEAKDTD